MRRLVDLTTFYPPHVGGVEQYAAELHRALLENDPGLEIVVVTSDRGVAGHAAPRPISERLRVLRYPSAEPITSFAVPLPGAICRLLRRAGVADADVVLTHTRFYPASRVGGAASRRLGAVWVHVEHGSTFVQSGGWFVRWAARAYDRTIGRRLLRRADHVIAIAPPVAQFVRQIAHVEATVISRGIARPVARGATVHRQSRADVRLVYVGRFVDGKGVRSLVRCHAALGNDVQLTLVGDGPDRPAVERLIAEVGTSQRVHLVGEVLPAEVSHHLAAADVFVNPSHSEGLPTAVLEAAAVGLPIVATDVGGTSLIVGDGEGGFLVPPRDEDALTAALQKMCQLPPGDRRKMGARARERVQERFDWRRTMTFLEDVSAARFGTGPR